jgi:hypothetical protein
MTNLEEELQSKFAWLFMGTCTICIVTIIFIIGLSYLFEFIWKAI